MLREAYQHQSVRCHTFIVAWREQGMEPNRGSEPNYMKPQKQAPGRSNRVDCGVHNYKQVVKWGTELS